MINATHLQLQTPMTTSILDSLKADGKKLTKSRKAILAILDRSAFPITAAEVHERLKKSHVSTDLVTVYRNLAMLKDLGLVNPVGFHKGQMRYEVRHGREHHHHIQCRGCGKIADLMRCPLKKLTQLIEEQTRFVVDGHALEFFGRCPQCR
jgi:Fe2+ or Zn2+ uptake regulation protein